MLGWDLEPPAYSYFYTFLLKKHDGPLTMNYDAFPAEWMENSAIPALQNTRVRAGKREGTNGTDRTWIMFARLIREVIFIPFQRSRHRRK